MKLHAVKLPLPENNSRGQNLKAINLIRSNKVFVEIEIKTMTLIYGTNKLKLKLPLLFLWCFACTRTLGKKEYFRLIEDIMHMFQV